MPPPRKFSHLKDLKHHFQHSQADSCVKKVPKTARYFLLNFDKKSVVMSYIEFSLLIIIVTPLLMLAKHNTSNLRGTKKCTVYFFLLFIYTCWEKDWSLVSNSVKVLWISEFAKMEILESYKSLRSDRPAL